MLTHLLLPEALQSQHCMFLPVVIFAHADSVHAIVCLLPLCWTYCPTCRLSELLQTPPVDIMSGCYDVQSHRPGSSLRHWYFHREEAIQQGMHNFRYIYFKHCAAVMS